MPPVHPSALPTPLVSTNWLAENLGRAGLVVVDASSYLPTAGRNAEAEYLAGHIPGAVFADIEWLSDETAPLPHTLLNAATFGERVGSLGIGSEDDVVVYDASGQNFSAPRLWYMLRSFGHDRVAVLDGGIRRWVEEARPVEAGRRAHAPATFHATLDRSRWRDLSAMLGNLVSGAEQVVDARSAGRFGATEPEPRPGVRGGHIPGSRNVHYARLVHEDGTMRNAPELQLLFAQAGVDVHRPIVTSCGTGITACAVALALEVAGAPAVAVYDGSWTEWGGRSDTPLETVLSTPAGGDASGPIR